MSSIPNIDTAFKMYSDTPRLDPDTHSLTLHKYHLLLWNKVLPTGKMYELSSNQTRPYYLHHMSELGNFKLSSDSIIHTYSKWKNQKMVEIIEQVDSAEVDSFYDLANTIGAYVIFPANKLNNKPTINGARGINPKIKDRFDLTLECIRRWYIGIESPLFADIERYKCFFDLFRDFQGYIKFFLLEDLVDKELDAIRFWLPFVSFNKTAPLPSCSIEYAKYMENASAFVKLRNLRIEKWVKENF